jgi:hypothetical protein
MLRQFFLLIVCAAAPPLGAWGLYYGTLYYLAASHKYIDPQTLHYAFLGELGLFYVAALMELRSRWTVSVE